MDRATTDDEADADDDEEAAGEAGGLAVVPSLPLAVCPPAIDDAASDRAVMRT